MLKNTKGIDVSHHQGEIQWEKVKADGIGFAVIRAGFGNSASQKDGRFEENIKGALTEGIPVGVYWFSYAMDAKEALKEAEVCHSILKPWKTGSPCRFSSTSSMILRHITRRLLTPARAERISFALSARP